jgi:NADH-quinone oxidoreductase subunit D
VDFSIPVSSLGDCYGRYLIRMVEMFESIRIVEYCISALSDRIYNKIDKYDMNMCSITFDDNLGVLYDHNMYNFYYDSKFSMEELIFFFRDYSDGYDIPQGSIYTVIEAPKGETGVLLVSDGSNKPYRCKIKAPGFLHLQGLNYLSKGFLLADVVTNLGSLDIVFGEVDR